MIHFFGPRGRSQGEENRRCDLPGEGDGHAEMKIRDGNDRAEGVGEASSLSWCWNWVRQSEERLREKGEGGRPARFWSARKQGEWRRAMERYVYRELGLGLGSGHADPFV